MEQQQRREMRVKEVKPAKVSYEVIKANKKAREEKRQQEYEKGGHTNLEEIGCLQEVMERYGPE